jgi:Spy/CpxP family protein refolding chaperone
MKGTLTLLFYGAAAAALAACSRQAPSESLPDAPSAAPAVEAASASAPEASASAAPSASAAQPPPAHHRGIAGMFFRAALDLELTDEARAAIRSIEDPLRVDPGSRHEAAAIRSDLVASLKAGRLEAAKIQADVVAAAKSIQARHEAQATALAGLHDFLNPEQRKAVAEAVRAPLPSHEHAAAASAGAEWAAHRLERMKSLLVLDADQEKQVGAILARQVPASAALQARQEASKKRLDALAAAFEKDEFDAKKVDLAAVDGRKPTEPIDREVRYVSELLPVLTPGQRDRLAALMEHPRGGHGDSIADPPPEPAGAGPR